MTYKELMALPIETLIAKYTEVIGEAPSSELNKQQMVSAVYKKITPAPPEKPKETKGENKKADEPTAVLIDENKVYLVKKEKGKVVDHLVLPKATWANLPASHKAEWEHKQPDELND